MNKYNDFFRKYSLLVFLGKGYLGDGGNFCIFENIDNYSNYYNDNKEKNNDYFKKYKYIINNILDDFDMSTSCSKFISNCEKTKNLYKDINLSIPLFLSLLADSGFDFEENTDISLRFIHGAENKEELDFIIDRFQDCKVEISANIEDEILKKAEFLERERMKEKLFRIKIGKRPQVFLERRGMKKIFNFLK
ncbi:MAG: hypothetical protein OIF36_02790 [Alphaproteobacteria bacterium]|nr:hypothetical protein [Alphaproteobacteria bacterium]